VRDRDNPHVSDGDPHGDSAPGDEGAVAGGLSTEDLEQDASAKYESPRYQRWVARTRRPLDWLAIVFLVDLILTWSFPKAEGFWFYLLQGISWFVWACFVLDYVVRLFLAAARRAFVRTHKADLAMVLLPMLRILRVLLLLRRSLKSVSTERIASSIVSIAVIVVAIGAFLVWRVESADPNANIHTFRESLWWAVVTVTTVGYGNLYPVTPQGEIIATVLMVVGISIIGTISATVAAWFVRRPRSTPPPPPTPPPPGRQRHDRATGDVAGAASSTRRRLPGTTRPLPARLDALAAEQVRLRELLESRPHG
jgi:voltage-gated potassium channel